MSNSTVKLVGMGDPVKDKEIPCTGMIKIGRDDKINTCPVKHASVSRQHAQIFQESGNWMVEDLKSTNGVFVNESKINAKTPLKNGDVVRVGDIPFKFHSDSMEATVATPKPAEAAAPKQAAAPAPKPAAAPAPRPAPAAAPKKEEGGGEDLFEPSIVGGADMGAAIRAAQAEAGKAAPAAKKPAPPPVQEGEFEGTMYGPQVARQLVKAIREEKEHQQEAAAKGGGAPAAKAAVAGPKVPNMFLLKIKASIFLILFLSAIGGGVFYLLSGRQEAEMAQKTMMAAKGKVEAFVEVYENQVLPAEELEQGRVLSQELAKLDEVQTAVKEAMIPLEKQPQYLAKVKMFDERVNFLIFERKFKQAILKQDKADAERLIANLSASGTTEQKAIVPMAKLAVKFQLFHRANQSEPKRSETPPAQKEVEELKALAADLENEYKVRSQDLLVLGKRFYNNAKEVIDNDLPAMLAWDRFWLEYKDYDTAKPEEKGAKAEQLKKAYPNMKMVQALK
jgi:hypothetical protein